MRKRLVQTSRGPVEIEISENGSLGLWVSVTPFADSGWEAQPTKSWWSNHKDGESLAHFLTRFVPLPASEAAQLAADVQGPWHKEWVESGGLAETQSSERWTSIVLSVVTAAVVLACVGLGLLIWLVAT